MTGPEVAVGPAAMALNLSEASLPAAAAPERVPPRERGEGRRLPSATAADPALPLASDSARTAAVRRALRERAVEKKM